MFLSQNAQPKKQEKICICRIIFLQYSLNSQEEIDNYTVEKDFLEFREIKGNIYGNTMSKRSFEVP